MQDLINLYNSLSMLQVIIFTLLFYLAVKMAAKFIEILDTHISDENKVLSFMLFSFGMLVIVAVIFSYIINVLMVFKVLVFLIKLIIN